MRHAAYVFDAYGTLFDVHAAVRRHAETVGPQGQALSELWRAKQLEYSWTRTLMGSYRDFWQLTQEALDFAMVRFPQIDPGIRKSLLDAYWSLDCYPEIPSVLKALKAEGVKLAILSNGSPEMLQSAVRSAAIEPLLDAVFSVDEVRRFKTDPLVYEIVTNAWRIYPEKVSFQSSNRWDIAGASRFGFHTVWINRHGQPDEYRDHAPDVVLPSLTGILSGR